MAINFDNDLVRSEIAALKRQFPNVDIGYNIAREQFVAYKPEYYITGGFIEIANAKTPRDLENTLKKEGI